MVHERAMAMNRSQVAVCCSNRTACWQQYSTELGIAKHQAGGAVAVGQPDRHRQPAPL